MMNFLELENDPRPLATLFCVGNNPTDLTPTKASAAGCPHPRSMILYPDLPCDPDVCAKSCAKGLNNGNGTCMRPLGCDCEYCVPAATVAKRPAAVSTRMLCTTTISI
jgi:hypothetical protein